MTYFVTSCSAFYWSAIPPIMCIAKHGVPGQVFDTQLLTAGALWLQCQCALLIFFIKTWSPLENGNAPSDQSLLRSQQIYILTAPLHVLAIIAGCRDGVAILFARKDASRWSSFDSILALTLVKLWVIGLALILVVSIFFGIFNAIFVDDSIEDRGVRFLGIFFCCVLLFIVELPMRGMFAYSRVIKEKSRPSLIDKLTAAIFGSKQPIRPDYIYLLLWVLLLAFSLRRLDSDGILNTRQRCSVDTTDPACQTFDPAEVTRVTGKHYGQGLGAF